MPQDGFAKNQEKYIFEKTQIFVFIGGDFLVGIHM
jgi:hypothetical protein